MRAVGTGLALALTAVLLRRPDLVVLAAPFTLAAVITLAGRPRSVPELRLDAPAAALLEGERLTATVTLSSTDRVDVAAVVLTTSTWLASIAGQGGVGGDAPGEAQGETAAGAAGGRTGDAPGRAPSGTAGGGAGGRTGRARGRAQGETAGGGGGRTGRARGGVQGGTAGPGGAGSPGLAVTVRAGEAVDIPFELRALRWGRHPIGPAVLTASAGWGLLRCDPIGTRSAVVTTWPLREGFAAIDAVPRAAALVGAHRSRRPGEGSDLAGVRPYIPGDRMRRINWRVTGRTGEVHVTATYSDRDTGVLLCLDSRHDIGRPPDSCLDTGVRAAAAIAEHYLRAGDRVSLIDLGQPARLARPGSGRGHLARVIDLLLDARPRPRDGSAPGDYRLRGLPAGDLVVLLGPLAGEAPLRLLTGLAQAGRSVIAVDTLPAGRWSDRPEPWLDLARRVWLLRRESDIARLADLGVPVVPWRGAGSLDQVLSDISRAARAPRGRPR